MNKAAITRYHKWVSTLPCAICGVEGSTQVAHYSGMDGNSLGKGMGKKAHDLMVFPACHEGANGCHKKVDSSELYEHQDPLYRRMLHSSNVQTLISETIIEAFRAGVIKV